MYSELIDFLLSLQGDGLGQYQMFAGIALIQISLGTRLRSN